ncbi:ATP phosphoribosyltransferase regulatory subunit [Pullulanibacillus pueri]|uniref:ATP phosphoribosyltransferase regulatory subunit n=1 Tax=Pullulanibacillus pueri TaxID=1437324 RepID=A0A8J3ELM3_9BACL|nr:ATP phosphoribosyltransferase regulatory subunit [Pullulanibacillus pueri]MBM7681078.1 ATP phosphoribosyltransferase regulatory subunit [Pullulanibacillus pueri]GGH76961.1 ATP phosphoribosyltransferase regulatory subunit [Pullulanibacillus pueri]
MQLPPESQDDLGWVVSQRLEIFETFRKTARLRGYNEITTPVIEYAETFTNPYVGMNLKTMLKWFDSEGDIEVLRPDWTIAIARALSSEHSSRKKWAYQGSVFQTDKPGIECRQAGIEIVDMDPVLGEVECLLLAHQFLQDIHIDPYFIELGHTGVFEALTQSMALGKRPKEQLRQAMHDKNKDEVYRISKNFSTDEQARELTELVDAFGSTHILADYEKRWKNQEHLLHIIHHLKKVIRLLEDLSDQEILIDLGRVKNLPYYSGIMFRGYSKTSGSTLFSGGRYDHLYHQFERKRTAVGLAFDVDELVQNTREESRPSRICLLADSDTLGAAEALRTSFEHAIVDVQFEEVDKTTYDKIFKIVDRSGQYEVIKE